MVEAIWTMVALELAFEGRCLRRETQLQRPQESSGTSS